MAKFCPKCGKATIRDQFAGRERDICPEGHFVQFAEYHNSVAALTFRDDAVLLVQHNHPSRVWSLPGGYIEQEEDFVLGLQREVREEAGVDLKIIGVVAMRQLVKETRNEFYLIMLCNVDNEQVTQSNDTDEILDAQFIPLDEISDWNITPFTRRVIEGYLERKPEPLRMFTIENYYPNAYMFGNV